MLKLINIKKDYKITKNTISVLNGVNLEFRKNEFVAILGPSGCGKTTLLNIIGGLDSYSDGDLIINGKSTKEYSSEDYDVYHNHCVSFIFQNYNLIPHLNVLSNVELSLTLSGVNKNERKKRAIEALEKVGLKDKLYNKPNQLSGGEIQRVAIARAIINNPDIILADEPTGSLDSKASLIVMDILKEISKEKLVIMVTHDTELVKEYANRTITIKDGVIESDTNPYVLNNLVKEKENVKRPIMKALTALNHSFKNLFTKKARTILTIIAGSIGIIGIALVLSLSNGFKKYMNKLEEDNISRYPLMIMKETYNLNAILEALNEDYSDLEKYPSIKKVTINKVNMTVKNITAKNNITKKYVNEVIKNIDPSLVNHIKYKSDVEMNLFVNNGLMKQEVNDKNMYVRLVTDLIWQEIMDNEDFMKNNFDVLQGRMPLNYNEVVIVVDRYNRMTNAALIDLGLYVEGQEKETFTFDELMNLEIKLLTNDEMYFFEDGVYKLNGVNVLNNPMVTQEAYDRGETIKVVGIIRADDSNSHSYLNTGVAYKSSLIKHIINENKNSELGKFLSENKNINPFTGNDYVSTTDKSAEELYNEDLKKYGADETPSSIEIYPKDFESKQKIKEYLDDYNDSQKKADKVIYLDIMDLTADLSESLIDGVTYVLIILSSISLIVSSIMIGVTTYVSVIERTKEIGILRSLGARKRDVARLFNAETIIIGAIAGLLGVITAYLFTIPINLIAGEMLPQLSGIASLKLIHGVILVPTSMILTLLSGIIPSLIAAKKDPATVLRND